MAKQSRSRTRNQDRGRGRSRTLVIRDGMDELEIPSIQEAGPGPLPGGTNGDPDDLQDGDLALEETEEANLENEFQEDEEDLAAVAGLSLETVLGSRPPTVLLHVQVQGDELAGSSSPAASPALQAMGGSSSRAALAGELAVLVLSEPATSKAAEALQELRLFVENRFKEGKKTLSEEEWARVIGAQPATLLERLLLLTRLAIAGSQEVREGNYKFTPNNRGLERYAGKFASLPDGTPFSLRLLLHDGRGRPDPHPFKQLPMAVKLQALHLALDAEQREGQASQDNAFRDKLQDALEQLGISLEEKPTQDHVINLRVSLQRDGLGDLFPKAAIRQQKYTRNA